jgi:hypothetical protein
MYVPYKSLWSKFPLAMGALLFFSKEKLINENITYDLDSFRELVSYRPISSYLEFGK